MHLIRDDILGQTRGSRRRSAKSLDQAESVALAACDVTASAVPMPWIFSAMNDSGHVGGHDLWTYGVEENRTTLSICQVL